MDDVRGGGRVWDGAAAAACGRGPARAAADVGRPVWVDADSGSGEHDGEHERLGEL